MAEERGIIPSVRQRLLNLSRERSEDFQFVLTRFALERLLYRLSKSTYADSFVLKGALLFLIWTGREYRPTRDLDLLGFDEEGSPISTGAHEWRRLVVPLGWSSGFSDGMITIDARHREGGWMSRMTVPYNGEWLAERFCLNDGTDESHSLLDGLSPIALRY